MKTILANGAEIPCLGFGTWEIDGHKGRDVVRKALEIGYRHFDTAAGYGNEADIGVALRAWTNREDLFVTTKVWPTQFEPALFRESVLRSVDALGVGAVDLLLLHWPNPDLPLSVPVEGLNWAVENGYARHIGVSNFTSRLIAECCQLSERPIAVNQVEYHPFLNQSAVLNACRTRGIAVTAYCPIARGRVSLNETILKIASAHARTPNQVALRWLVQQDMVAAIPRTSNPGRAKENFDIFDFELTGEDMRAIASQADPKGRLVPDEEMRQSAGMQSNGGHAAAPFVPKWDLTA